MNNQWSVIPLITYQERLLARHHEHLNNKDRVYEKCESNNSMNYCAIKSILSFDILPRVRYINGIYLKKSFGIDVWLVKQWPN